MASAPHTLAADPALEFLRLLWSIEHKLQRVSKRMDATHGVTGPQRLVLRVVREMPDLTARELGEILHLHASTLTGIVQRLEKKGYLARKRDDADHRRIKLRVTAGAHRLVDRKDGTIETAIKAALTSLSGDRIRTAQSTLAEISRALDRLTGD